MAWRRKHQHKIVTLLACSVHFVTAVDGFGASVLLADIRTEFGLNLTQAQWVLTAFGLALVAGLLVGGRACDRYGTRRVLVCGLAAFGSGAAFAAAAWSPATLVASRALQGVGAAAAMPAGLAMLARVHPPGRARDQAMGALGAMATAGMATGLVAAGLVVQILGWRTFFALCAAATLIPAVVLHRAQLPGPSAPRDLAGGRGLDLPSALAVTGAAACLVLAITDTTHQDTPGPTIPLLLAISTLLVGLLAWRSRHLADPLVDVSALKIPRVASVTIGVAANSMAFTAIVFALPQILRDTLGVQPVHVSLTLLPVTVAAFLVSLAARRVGTWPAHRAAAAGFATGATGLAATAALTQIQAPLLMFVPALLLVGVGLAVAFTVCTQQLLHDVPPHRHGGVSGLFETSQHLAGGTIGLACYATTLQLTGPTAPLAAIGLGALIAALATITTRGMTTRRPSDRSPASAP